MSSAPLAETEDAFDLTDAVPETERLDSSLQKAKAQLSIKTRRHRPSRSRLRDSLSSTEGDDSVDGKQGCSGSPLHVSLLCPSPFSDLQCSFSPARKDRAFTFEIDKKAQGQSSACLLTSSPTHLIKGDLLPQWQKDHAPVCHKDHFPRGQEESLELWLGDHLMLHNKENSHLQYRERPHHHQEDQNNPHQDDNLLLDLKDHTQLCQMALTHLQWGGNKQLDQEDHTHLQQGGHMSLDQAGHIFMHQRDHLQKDHMHLQKGGRLQNERIHLQKGDHLQKRHTQLQKGDNDQKDHTHQQKGGQLKNDLIHLQCGGHIQPEQDDDICLQQRDHLQKDLTYLPKRDYLKKPHTHLHKRDHLQTEQNQKNHDQDHSPLHSSDYSQSEDDAREMGSDEPSSPTVLLDKKTRRRFLDLRVTLRRTYGKVRRERANGHAVEFREPDGAESHSSRPSGPPFASFSWLTERIRGSGSQKNSNQSPTKSLSEEEELKNNTRSSRNESSQPYQSLSDHSEEGRDENAEPCVAKKKPILPFSTGARDRTEKQDGVRRDKRDDGHDGDGQKLLTSQSQFKHFN